MNLQDVIKNLPKTSDIIKQIKNKITNNLNILENQEKLIELNEKKIKMAININLMDKDIVNEFNKLIKLNINLMKEQNKIYSKIKKYNDKIEILKKDKVYPTEWVGGKIPGEILETEDGYRAIYEGNSRSFKYKNIKNSTKMIACTDKEDCRIKAEKHLYEYYDGLGKIANKYRLVNFNTLEVQLPQDKTFITDSKFIDVINDNRIGIKHDKRYDKYYITYVETPKVNKLFTELAFEVLRAKFANDCDFDLRESNIIDTDNAKLIHVNNNVNNNVNNPIKLNIDGLEMYKWIKGKYSGTVFQRANQLKWSIIVKKSDGSVATKTLSFTEATKDKVYKEAIEIKNGLSDTFSLTSNKIKIIDGDKIEVKLTKDQVMITDYKFLHIVEKYRLFATKSSDKNSKYYVSLEVGGVMHKYHKFITGWVMVDHIDRNPMNNCLNNLRETTHKLNNNNRTKSESSNAIELGVTYSAKDDSYKARIKQDGKEISKQFSIKKYGKEEALRLAIETRREFNHAYNCLNG
jgi:hypothetical protein